MITLDVWETAKDVKSKGILGRRMPGSDTKTISQILRIERALYYNG